MLKVESDRDSWLSSIGSPLADPYDIVMFTQPRVATNQTVSTADPDVNYIDALAPYQPVQMRVVHCPIDTRLSFAQANKLIRDLRPRQLVVPEVYTSTPALQPGTNPV